MHAALRPAPTDAEDLAAEMVDRIIKVQRQHHRETGLKLSYAAAFDEVTRRALADEPVDGDARVAREVLETIAWHLASLGYHQHAIDGALADISRCGTAQCSEHIDDDDRGEIEDFLPEAPADAWKGPKRKGLLWGGMVAR